MNFLNVYIVVVNHMLPLFIINSSRLVFFKYRNCKTNLTVDFIKLYLKGTGQICKIFLQEDTYLHEGLHLHEGSLLDEEKFARRSLLHHKK